MEKPHNTKALKAVWPDIEFAWPASVGNTFSKFISGLVSKPSLVVWLNLLYTLQEYVRLLKDGKCDENTLFLVDLASALLCDYFAGARLAEQSDKTWEQIETNRTQTHALLKDFGEAILSQEHNIRTMNAFLKICYSSSSFDLLLWYYSPDSIDPEGTLDKRQLSETLFSYLHATQWTLIEQRITNFGRGECKVNINKLCLQKVKASALFSTAKKNLTTSALLSAASEDENQISAILLDVNASMFLEQLNHNEKVAVCNLILDAEHREQLIQRVQYNKEFLEILHVALYQHIGNKFGTSKKSIFNSIDFDNIFSFDDAVVQGLKSVILQHICGNETTLKKYCEEEIINDMELLQQLPVEYIGSKQRNVLFLLNLSLYCNVKMTRNQKMMDQSLRLIKSKPFFFFLFFCLKKILFLIFQFF